MTEFGGAGAGRPGTGEISGLGARVRLPVGVEDDADPDTTLASTRQLLDALSLDWLPAQLRFVMSSGAGLPAEASWEIAAVDRATADGVAAHVKVLADALLMGVELGEPVPVEPDGSRAERRTERRPEPPSDAAAEARTAVALVATRRARVEFARWSSPAWRAAAGDRARWTLTVDFEALPSPGTRDDPDEVPVTEYPPILAPGSVPPGMRMAGCRIRLSSVGDSVAPVAIHTLFANDTRGPYGLEAVPVDAASAEVTWLPGELAAFLAIAPARAAEARVVAAPDPGELFTRIEAASTPHALVLGASGQGKTVFLANLAARAAQLGESACVVDVQDGWLAEQAAAASAAHELPVLFGDFSNPRVLPRVDLAAAPRGISRQRWADDLFDIVRRVLWADEPAEHFGKVGERLLATLLKIPVLDPNGTVGFEDLAGLLTSPGRDAERLALLARIGDRELASAVETEIIPMLRQRDPGNAAAWLFSALTPLTRTPVFRRDTGRRRPLNIEAAVARGRTIVLYAPASELGDTSSRLLVTVLLHRVWLATRRLADPQPRHVLVDEWQLYPSSTMEAMLSQGRKYGLRMRLANQNLAQLPTRLRDSVLGNSGSILCFRLGPADAALVDGLFPTVPRTKLQTLPRHTIAATFGDVDMIVAAPDLPQMIEPSD